MSAEAIDRFRKAETDFKIAHAKAVVKHRGEGSEFVVSALALVDCEEEYREFTDALSEREKMTMHREDVVLDANAAAAEYHRSWATKKDAWAE
jgi:hypothetical protein